MIYPDDERIAISPSMHSISVTRDITTPGYSFPNQANLAVTKSFLKAGMQGLGGCGVCGGLGDTLNLGDWALLGAVAMFIVPHFIKMR